jgi:hypothetical protein
MTVPRLGCQGSHDDANALIPRPGRCWRSRQAPRDGQRGPLLTDCSQTVRIHLDVVARCYGRPAGQGTATDTPGPEGMGWWGSNPGTPLLLARSTTDGPCCHVIA